MANEKVGKSYHCALQIHYHTVFPVKYRKTLLDSEITNIIQETAEGIAEHYPIEMEAIGCDKDHIHLLCESHPKVTPGRIARYSRALQPVKYSGANHQ
jgi:putative transposase